MSAKVETIEVDMQAIQKQGYDHFLLKEISEQPQTLRSTLNGRVDVKDKLIRLGGLNMTTEELKKVETHYYYWLWHSLLCRAFSIVLLRTNCGWTHH